MKPSIYLIGLAASVFAVSCQPDEFDEPIDGMSPLVAEYESAINIEVTDSNYVHFSFDQSKAPAVTPVWILDGAFSSEIKFSKYYRKAGEYSIDVKFANANGISDGMITRTFVVERTVMTGFAGFDATSVYNMWKPSLDEVSFYYAPGWSQINDPQYSYVDGSWTVSLPEATSETWQAQMHIPTAISTASANQYDFSVILMSSTEHNNVTVKLVDAADDNIFYFTETISLKPSEPQCFWKARMDGIDISKLKLVLDFGGNAQATGITIENIVLKNSADDDGTVIPEIPSEGEEEFEGFDADSEFNIFAQSDESLFFYYAPNWAQIADPSCTIQDHTYELTLSEATSETWQAQMHIPTNISTSSANNYDFSVKLTSTADHGNVTVKLVDANDDNIFYFAESIKLTAGITNVFWKAGMVGQDISKLKLVFDFGGNVAGTIITIEDIVLKNSANDDGTIVPSTSDIVWVDVESDENMWNGVAFTNTYFYAPGWAQIADPTMSINGSDYNLILPYATSEQWQCQVFFISDALSLSAENTYDFQVTFLSTTEIKNATIKIAENEDDGVFLFTERTDIPANAEYTFEATMQPGVDITKAKIVFDFGGNPDNTDLTISDIILQVHKE